jgi:ABC1 atypical kinase-like domain
LLRVRSVTRTCAVSSARFRTNFAAEQWVKVPKVVWERTSPEVLTMEYAPGIKINRVEDLDKLGIDRKRLARLTVESYLQQLLTFGFFHAGAGGRLGAGHPASQELAWGGGGVLWEGAVAD